MKISIGADHAGYEYKSKLVAFLKEKKLSITDHGTNSPESVDYPDFSHPVATDVETGKSDLGILICGSGNGVAMAANKHPGVRAALCWNEELAELARAHNNANVLCLPSRFISYETCEKLTSKFIETDFEGGRHERRVDKIGC